MHYRERWPQLPGYGVMEDHALEVQSRRFDKSHATLEPEPDVDQPCLLAARIPYASWRPRLRLAFEWAVTKPREALAMLYAVVWRRPTPVRRCGAHEGPRRAAGRSYIMARPSPQRRVTRGIRSHAGSTSRADGHRFKNGKNAPPARRVSRYVHSQSRRRTANWRRNGPPA